MFLVLTVLRKMRYISDLKVVLRTKKIRAEKLNHGRFRAKINVKRVRTT